MSSTSSNVSVERLIKTTQPKQHVEETRAYTPDTVLSELQLEPDITVLCRICAKRINIRQIQNHRSYHDALHTLEYKDNKKPANVDSLLARRQYLVKKAPQSNIAIIQKVNDAYELVKSVLQGTFDDLRQVNEPIKVECMGQPLNCSAKCIHAMSICSDGNERWKSKMEDTYVFQDFFGNDINKCFFAVYDGHNGRFAADIAAYDFHHFLLNEMTKFDANTTCKCTVNHAGKIDIEDYGIDRKPARNIRKESIRHILHEESMNVIQQIMHTCEENVQQLKEDNNPDCHQSQKGAKKKRVKDPFSEKMEIALQKAYVQTDNILKFGIDEKSRVRWSGCSAVTCVIESTRNTELDEVTETVDSVIGMPLPQERGLLYIANSGNVRAVLCRNGKAYKVTRDHMPSNLNERNRVLKTGAEIRVSQKGARINGVLDTTRGFGNHGDPELKRAVIVDPYTTTVTIDQYAEFLIIATNGLWEVLSEDEAVSIIYEMIPTDEIPSPTPEHVENFAQAFEFSKANAGRKLACSVSEESFEQDGGRKCKKNEMEVSLELDQRGEKVNDYNEAEMHLNDDADTVKGHNADFENMVSTLMENDDGNDADIETLTELHTIYTQSQLSLYHPTEKELYRNLAKNMSERLVQSALLAGSRDNISVIVILLPACKI
ncbi:protein phosphatase 2C-like domain-containing protein 1 [Anneissia japonica]|uniref:protein phosphatase 2C-like domain-containing protein 1 n=1 Tax=Anneissia japonica TaxID=1529436 RepID=UPI0014256DD5|nr:protein phosphatase 2C-like domain-containing protein 1 [Anneissia japonica]XP_033101577.1 protein phosphatase 2C-like domain-containing protein 1 [Anneissia japonica]XP_033101578.1 protein phosphatase 2C-like domain-containing protein 1 [Anneissia japonica]